MAGVEQVADHDGMDAEIKARRVEQHGRVVARTGGVERVNDVLLRVGAVAVEADLVVARVGALEAVPCEAGGRNRERPRRRGKRDGVGGVARVPAQGSEVERAVVRVKGGLPRTREQAPLASGFVVD